MFQIQIHLRTPMGLLPKLREMITDFSCAYSAEDFGDLLPTWDVLVGEGRIQGAFDAEGLQSIRLDLRELDCFLDDILDLAKSLVPLAVGPTAIQVFEDHANGPVAAIFVLNGIQQQLAQ